MSALQQTLTYIAAPALAPLAGAAYAAWRPPGQRLRSTVQHVAAGLVIAAVSVELLPDLLAGGRLRSVVPGFVAGVVLLLVVRRLAGGHVHDEVDADAPTATPHQHLDDGRSPAALLLAIGVDVAVDGLLIGVGFAAGAEEGRLLTLALTIEVLFLGMTAMTALRHSGLTSRRRLLLAGAPGLLLAATALLGAGLLSGLHGDARQAFLAFGVAALLYLVTEELLIEAHQTPDEELETAAFFAGFLAALVLAML